jgi:two-component system LytT family response regulator
MKVVIVEDERAASENLVYHLKRLEPAIEILETLDSVKSAVAFFSAPHEAELVFMDIHLADGLSFEIFDKVGIKAPVIFTTAYDQYALKAFKVHSIDYLLKPISQQELGDALRQFKTQSHGKADRDKQLERLLGLMDIRKRAYKTTILVSQRDQLVPLKTESIAYLHIETGIVKLVTRDNQLFLLDKTLEDLENELDPDIFCRLNRQCLANREAITNITQYFNGKLIVKLDPPLKERVVVSKAKAREFKEWLGS